MLCACSGEQFQFEDAPQSPKSLATRDFTGSGPCLSSRTTGRKGSKFDDTQQVDDVESALKDTLSLNYEEARALLGRLEYQRGSHEAALQVFQGIDAHGLKPRMMKALVLRTKPRRSDRSKGELLQSNVMSLHSVTLILEAIFLRSKCLEMLRRHKDAAFDCANIFEIFEGTWPNGWPEGIADDFKLQETFHKVLQLLPKLWEKAGFLDEAVTYYRKALAKHWNLDTQTLAGLQKDLAVLLLHCGCELLLPPQLHQTWCSDVPQNNMEEAILLLSILFQKAVCKEIAWDPEIMEHLLFALSMSDQTETAAFHLEEILPGVYNREERWYLLALCYNAAGQNEVALNLLRKGFDFSNKKRNGRYLLSSLLLAVKLCSQNKTNAREGISLAQKALTCVKHQDKHLVGVIYHLLGVCYSQYSRASTSDTQRRNLQKSCLEALECASRVDNSNPELIFSLALSNAMQRNLQKALDRTIKYCDMVAGTTVTGLKLIALTLSAEQNYQEAESIIDLAIDETRKVDQLELLRLKAILQNFQNQPKKSIESYTKLLALVQSLRETKPVIENSMLEVHKNFEMEAWLDLANIYINLGLLSDSDICLKNAMSFGYYSPRTWYTSGKLFEARGQYNDALASFYMSCAIEADYVPSMVSTAAILTKLGSSSLLPIARSFLMNALRLHPTDHEAWLNLGYVLKKQGLLLQAADCFQAAYELKQSSPVLDFFSLQESSLLI